MNNIVNGHVNSVQSKYIIEPTYILKNISSGLYKQMSLKSFKYYRSTVKDRNLQCEKKFEKLFETDKKIREFAKSGISFKDKNYSKLYSKLSKEEQKQYQNFLSEYDNQEIKTDLELHNELENSIIDFLSLYGFVCKSPGCSNSLTGYELTPKGLLACEFNEINPIIFTNHLEHIMGDSTKILPILSMFIDDGIKITDDEIILWDEVEPEIIYWENTMKKYSRYIGQFPKWTYWAKNYLVVKEWLENLTMSIDEISSNYQIDPGLFVKILIKMYQVSGELIEKLDKLNMGDLTEKLSGQKELLIRYPLKIDSLYINL